jgi:hypothetical protein
MRPSGEVTGGKRTEPAAAPRPLLGQPWRASPGGRHKLPAEASAAAGQALAAGKVRVSIAGMVIWVLTAGIGIYLLAVGIAAQRAAGTARAGAAAATAARAAGSPAAGTAATVSSQATAAGSAPDVTDSAAPDRTDSAAVGTPAGTDSTAVGTQALAVVMSGGAAPAAPPIEGSPLLEFTHPALALLGLTFWIFFVMTGDRLFAWIAFGVVVATVTAGLSWELSRRHTARQRAARQRAARGATAGPGSGPDSGGQDSGRHDGATDGPGFPPHLVLAHGAAAACTFALVVIAAVAAGHG